MKRHALVSTRQDQATALTATAARIARVVACNEGEAEEILSQLLVEMTLHWDALAVHPNPVAWLRRCIKQDHWDLHRSSWSKLISLEREAGEVRALESDPASTYDQAAFRRAVSEAIASLPTRERDAVARRHLGGERVCDIAEAMGVGPEQVRRLLRRGEDGLRVALAEWHR